MELSPTMVVDNRMKLTLVSSVGMLLKVLCTPRQFHLANQFQILLIDSIDL